MRRESDLDNRTTDVDTVVSNELDTTTDVNMTVEDNIKILTREETFIVSYAESPDIFVKFRKLRDLCGERNEGMNEGLLSFMYKCLEVEKNEINKPEEIGSLINYLDVEIQKIEFKNEIDREQITELTPDTLQQQEQLFHKGMKDLVYENLLKQVHFLEALVMKEPFDGELIESLSQRELEKFYGLMELTLAWLEQNQSFISKLQGKSGREIVLKFKRQHNIYEQFIHTLAHDYRLVLGNVKSFSELFNDSGSQEDNDLFKEVIMRRPKELENILMMRLLLIQYPNYKEHTLATIFEQDLEEIQSNALFKKITIDVEHSDQVVFSDSSRMSVFLNNFMNNAIKFTPEGGNIKLWSEVMDDGYIKVSVSDIGNGLSSKKLEHFQKMFSGKIKPEKTNSHPGTNGEIGTGKGLKNCMELAQQLGARFTVESEEGKGSTFSFIVPATKEQHDIRVQQEEERTQKVYTEVPLLVRGILANAEKREAKLENE